jgi:hypothetical protein
MLRHDPRTDANERSVSGSDVTPAGEEEQMRLVGSIRLPVFAVLGLVSSIAGCGTAEDSTDTVSSALLENNPYLQGQSLQARSGSGPGATIFQGKAFFSYVRTDSHIGIVIDSNLSNGGGQSATTYALPDTANFGAALFAFGGFLDLFYVGQDSNLYMKRSADGVNWSQTWALDTEGFWLYVPSPVALNGQLALFAAANLISGHVIFQVNISNNTISNIFFTATGSGVTNRGPTAAAWNGNVYLSWAGTDANNTIHIQHIADLGPSGTWSAMTALAEGGYPALIPLTNQTMELVFRGNDAHIYRTYTSDGVSFGAATKDNASTTNQKPIAFIPQGSLDAWVYYIGQNSGLYTALE